MARALGVRRAGGALEVELEGGGSVRARRVIVALGRSGNFRMLGVPGEHRDKVANRLHDPKDFAGQRVLVVGGGDSAIETAIALALAAPTSRCRIAARSSCARSPTTWRCCTS